MADPLLESIAGELRVYDSLASVAVSETAWGYTLRMPPASEADYRFVFSRERDGEYRIELELLGAPELADASLLWYLHRPFDVDDFQGSLPALEVAFRSHVTTLVHSRTRIRQQRGWLLWRLKLEREVAPSQWTLVNACALPRRSGAFGQASALHTYHSPPVVPQQSNAPSV